MAKVWIDDAELKSIEEAVDSLTDGLDDLERLRADARMLKARLAVIRATHKEPTDPDKTPPRPYSSGELRAVRNPEDPQSGMTTPGGFRPPLPRKR